MDLPSCIRSNAVLISSSPHRVGHERCQLDLAGHGVFHHAGQLLRPFHAAKASSHLRPVTSWKGQVLTLPPGHADDHALAPATVRIPAQRASLFTLPMHSKLWSTPQPSSRQSLLDGLVQSPWG